MTTLRVQKSDDLRRTVDAAIDSVLDKGGRQRVEEFAALLYSHLERQSSAGNDTAASAMLFLFWRGLSGYLANERAAEDITVENVIEHGQHNGYVVRAR